MLDCVKCWNTPCTCGYDYRNWSKDFRIKQASVVLGMPDDLLKDVLGNYVPEVHPLKEPEDN